MSYTDAKEMSAAKFWSIVLVVLLHLVIGYAFVTGLAMSVVKKVATDLKTFDVVEEPPPPEELPPPPPPDQKLPPPPVVTPPPIVQTQVVPQNTVVSVPNPPPVFVPSPAPPAPPPPPPPPSVATKAQARGGAGQIDNSAYPPAAIRNEEQGVVIATFTIGTDGRVTACSTTGATPSLQQETCRQIQRWRYRPAQDASGNPIAETRTQRVRWELPD